MSLQKQIARGVAKSNLGRKLQVLVEGEASTEQLKTSQIQSWEHGFTRGGKQSAPQLNGRYFIGRSEADAPGIDGRVYVRGRLPAGQFAQVKIIGHTDYDLVAEPA
jgi:tRNA A37 methylthiotransferase MiaB